MDKQIMKPFEINGMTRFYHLNNIEVVADGMDKQLDIFAKKNGTSKAIEEKKAQLVCLKSAAVYISKLFAGYEKEKAANLELKIQLQKAEALIQAMKIKIDELTNTINF